MGLRKGLRILGSAVLVIVLTAPGAAAYLDPGTGAAIWQFLAASFLGLLFALKMFWRRIVDGFRRMWGKEAADDAK